MKKILISSLILCSISTMALSASNIPCNFKENATKIITCFSKKSTQLETTMTEKYNLFLQRSDANEKPLLQKSQAAWLDYKNNYCQLIYQHYSNVTVEYAQLQKVQCIYSFDLAQTKVLEDGASQFRLSAAFLHQWGNKIKKLSKKNN